jgi:hypothetical protein
MCACDSEYTISESFVIPGQCTSDGCADQQALCAAACEDMQLDGQRFTMGWWDSTCEAE